MKPQNLLLGLLIILVLSLNAYCIIEGLKYRSYLGIVLSFGSLLALMYVINLVRKIKQAPEEDEELLQ